MSQKFNMTVELTEFDVKEAIAACVRQQLGDNAFLVSASDVSIQVDKQTDMRGESMGYRVLSARVRVKKPGPDMDR